MNIVARPDESVDGVEIRHDWSLAEVRSVYHMPFSDLLYTAQRIHRLHFDPNKIQISTLLSIKTGGCPEDCKYCSQSARYNTDVEADKLMDKAQIVEQAKLAMRSGADRFCMGAAWRELKDRDLERVCDIVAAVKQLGMETCATLGMLTVEQARELSNAGLDYYNHNIDTSRENYGNVITTRTFDDRLETLAAVRLAGMKTCCGGIIGLGESLEDRLSMLRTLATLPEHPQSVPINLLVPVAGTPYADNDKVDSIELVRLIATARIIMPQSVVRLSAGRTMMSDETQALAFLAGANSIFHGDKLLTADNPREQADRELMERLGISPIASPGQNQQ